MIDALFLTDNRTSEAARARLLEAVRLGVIPRGKVSDAAIAHDDWCPALRGRGCTCIPDLTIVAADGAVWRDVGRGWERQAS